MRRVLNMGLALITALSLMALVWVAPVNAATTHTSSSTSSSQYDHIFYIMMENHATNEIFGNTADAPYINSLAQRYNIGTQYFGVTHPQFAQLLSCHLW